ncbi:hypothetical protein FOA52_004544 [Chlamydomonas sp. UWO 241]|nr:hypothetical protein FOA52_004544 [Chlamydomonas sp. UWO 241]
MKKKPRAGEAELTPKLQRIVDLLLPPARQGEPPGLPTRDNAIEFARREAVAAAAAARRQSTWEADMWEKHTLQRAALRALPPHLRAAALAPDVSPFPPDRQMLYQTPPEAYRAPAAAGGAGVAAEGGAGDEGGGGAKGDGGPRAAKSSRLNVKGR